MLELLNDDSQGDNYRQFTNSCAKHTTVQTWLRTPLPFVGSRKHGRKAATPGQKPKSAKPSFKALETNFRCNSECEISRELRKIQGFTIESDAILRSIS